MLELPIFCCTFIVPNKANVKLANGKTRHAQGIGII